MINRILIPILLLYTIAAFEVRAEDTERSWRLTGKVGLTGKYDSDMTLTLGQYGNTEHRDDIVEELSLSGTFDQALNENWRLNIDVQGFGNWPMEHRESSWYVGNANLYVGYTKDKNTVSFLDTVRYYSMPKDRSYDFVRNSATLAYKRIFTDLWEARIGYENIANAYIESADLNYFLNGGFLELRNTWTPLFSTYYTYGFLFYQGSMSAAQDGMPSSPNAGYRHTGEIGFDWVFAGKNNLTAAYAFQLDNSEQNNWVQHGDFEGDQGALENDAEFNFIKNKGTLLFSHRFNRQFSLTFYSEFIHKYYLSRVTSNGEEANGDEQVVEPARTDLLFLTSTWLTMRFYDNLFGKIRYIFRMNESTQNDQDYRNHIVSVGLEFRF